MAWISDQPPLEPIWGALVTATASLAGTLPVAYSLMASSGMDIFLQLIYAPVYFIIAFGIVNVVLSVLLRRIDTPVPRAAIIGVAILVLLLAVTVISRGGFPVWEPLLAAILALLHYRYLERNVSDEHDLRELFPNRYMTKGVGSRSRFDREFADPLWRRIGLGDLVLGFTSLLEGQQNGYSYMVADLAHSNTKLWNNKGGEITTFFIIELPRKAAGWRLTRQPAEMLAYADTGHLYLAKVGSRPRVRKWPAILDEAIKIAESLQELTAEEAAKAAADEPRPNAWNKSWAIFVIIVAGLLPLFFVGISLSELSEFRRLGYIKSCQGVEEYAKVLTGRDAWTWIAGLGAPLPGLVAQFWLWVRFYDHRRFRIYLTVAGLITIALAWEGGKVAIHDAVWKASLDNGQQVACFVRLPQQAAGQ